MSKSKSQKLRKILIILIPLLILAAVITTVIIIRINTPPCSGLRGSWRYDGVEYTEDYIITFEDQTHGKYDMAGDIQTFTYEDFSDYFSILFPDNDIPANYTYQISEDNKTLTIQDSNDSDSVFVCQ